MEIVFLGTGSMVPTKERNPSATFLSYGSEGILIDCAEGTQRQMKLTGIKLTKITKILITHWHGDHVLGLPGLLQSLGASEYDKKLKIYGPKGTKVYMKYLEKFFIFDRNVNLEVFELSSGVFYENEDFSLSCLPLKHGVPTLGFEFKEKDKRKMNIKKLKLFGLSSGPEIGQLQKGKDIKFKGKLIKCDKVSKIIKGKKVSYIADTALCNSCYKLAQDADILICESTYASDLKDKAKEYNHMTAKQAASIANSSNAKRLVLNHFSGRYKDLSIVESDARDLFDSTECAIDFMKIKI